MATFKRAFRRTFMRTGASALGAVLLAAAAGVPACGEVRDEATAGGAARAGGDSAASPEGALRQRAPLAGTISTTRQPTFRWFAGQRVSVPAPARIEVCFDRACDVVITSFEGTGGSARAPFPLPSGVLFWRVVARAGRGAEQVSASAWPLVIPWRESGTDSAWGTYSDFDGDGLADVAIGAPALEAPEGSGQVYVYYGTEFPFNDPVVLNGYGDFGRTVASVGDVNGDGSSDLFVAHPLAGTPGEAQVLLSSPSGFEAPTFLLPGPVTMGFGASAASAGDVNGDGYGDIVVGGFEVAQIFLGGPAGPSTVATLALRGRDVQGFGEPPGATRVEGPADVNGDGRPDLLVGDGEVGVVYLAAEAAEGEPAFHAQLISHGRSAFAGDLNGDGYSDVASGPVVAGTPAGASGANVLFIQAGEGMSGAAGDLDGDGFSEVIAQTSEIENFPDRERVYFGAPGSCGDTGCRPHIPLEIPGHSYEFSSSVGAVIAGVGDLNGDGLDDLVAATPEAGRAYVFVSKGRTSPQGFGFVRAIGPGAGSRFGTSLSALFGSSHRFFAGSEELGGPTFAQSPAR